MPALSLTASGRSKPAGAVAGDCVGLIHSTQPDADRSGDARPVSALNLTLRQRLLKVSDPIAADLGSLQVERLKIGQRLEMNQSGIGDFGVPETQFSGAVQPFEVC